MKIIISSKGLAAALNKIDFNNDYIEGVEAINNELCFICFRKIISCICHTNSNSIVVKQIDSGWENVRKLVNQVDEQPIVLIITENVINIKFQY